jgi:hypothetical protein
MDEDDAPIRGATQGPTDIEPDTLSVVAVPHRGTVRVSIDHWRAGGEEIEISERGARELMAYLRGSLAFLRGRPAVTRAWRTEGTSRLRSTPLALDAGLTGEYGGDAPRTARLRIQPRTPSYASPLATIELDAGAVEVLVQRLAEAQRQLGSAVPALG